MTAFTARHRPSPMHREREWAIRILNRLGAQLILGRPRDYRGKHQECTAVECACAAESVAEIAKRVTA